MLDRGAKIDALNDVGAKAWDLCVALGNERIVSELVRRRTKFKKERWEKQLGALRPILEMKDDPAEGNRKKLSHETLTIC